MSIEANEASFCRGPRNDRKRLDDSLEADKEKNDFLQGVPAIVDALRAKKIECKSIARTNSTRSAI